MIFKIKIVKLIDKYLKLKNSWLLLHVMKNYFKAIKKICKVNVSEFKSVAKKCLKLTSLPLRKKCPYLEFFCSVFSHIRTEYGKIRSISPYSVQIRENADEKTPNTDTFYAVFSLHIFNYLSSICLF